MDCFAPLAMTSEARPDLGISHRELGVAETKKAPEMSPGPFACLATNACSLLLVLVHDRAELVVVLHDEIDVALVLDRRTRILQRAVELLERLLLVVGGHLLVGVDLGDLRLDD